MFCDYVQVVMSRAVYKVLDDEEPYYNEVPELKGVLATGKTSEGWRTMLRHSP
jgi:predicted RNase H-like HicB family nuclease